MSLTTTIREVQAAVGVEPDGKPGPVTWAAIHGRLVAPAAPSAPDAGPADAGGTLDPRSEKTIATLHPRVHPHARALVNRAAEKGIVIRLISGTRSDAEQNALYAQGRTKPGRIVTNARAGYSNHNFGIAFDVGIFKGASYIAESPLYKVVGSIGMEIGLEWGGNWKTIRDEPHFQRRPPWARGMSESAMLAELRRRKAAGIDAFA